MFFTLQYIPKKNLNIDFGGNCDAPKGFGSTFFFEAAQIFTLELCTFWGNFETTMKLFLRDLSAKDAMRMKLMECEFSFVLLFCVIKDNSIMTIK